jgi:hypothetical protein
MPTNHWVGQGALTGWVESDCASEEGFGLGEVSSNGVEEEAVVGEHSRIRWIQTQRFLKTKTLKKSPDIVYQPIQQASNMKSPISSLR